MPESMKIPTCYVSLLTKSVSNIFVKSKEVLEKKINLNYNRGSFDVTQEDSVIQEIGKQRSRVSVSF